MKLNELITEGGNIFRGEPATQRIAKNDVPTTVSWLSKLLGIDFSNNLLGTTGLKDTSGDIDIGIDANSVNKDDVIAKLTEWTKSQNLNPKDFIKKSGYNVHFRAPINGDANRGFVQVDLMFVPNLELAKFTLGADPNSKYRGEHRSIILSSIAKVMGMKYAQAQGLIDRVTNKIVADTPDSIAKTLFGPNASAKTLSNVETILQALENDPKREEKLADAKETLEKRGIHI